MQFQMLLHVAKSKLVEQDLLVVVSCLAAAVLSLKQVLLCVQHVLTMLLNAVLQRRAEIRQAVMVALCRVMFNLLPKQAAHLALHVQMMALNVAQQ